MVNRVIGSSTLNIGYINRTRAYRARTNGAEQVGGRGGAKPIQPAVSLRYILPQSPISVMARHDFVGEIGFMLEYLAKEPPAGLDTSDMAALIKEASQTNQETLRIALYLKAIEVGKADLKKADRTLEQIDRIGTTLDWLRVTAKEVAICLLQTGESTGQLLALAVYDELNDICQIKGLDWLAQRHEGFARQMRRLRLEAAQAALDIGQKLTSGLMEKLVARSQQALAPVIR